MISDPSPALDQIPVLGFPSDTHLMPTPAPNQTPLRKNRLSVHLAVDVSGTDIHGERFFERTRSLNVSGGGICFVSRRDLAVGGRLFLDIELPFRLRKHFGDRSDYEVRAVICRVEPAIPGEFSRVGARFLGETKESRRS